MSASSNAYLEQRRSKLIANETLLRSLGLLPPVSSTSSSAAADKAKAKAQAAASSMETEEPNPEASSKEKEALSTNERSRPSPVIPLRRSTRQILPRQKRFMEEDFDTEKKKKIQGTGRNLNGALMLAPFPYVPSGKNETLLPSEPLSKEARQTATLAEHEKGSEVAVVWEAHEAPGSRVRRYFSEDEEDEEEEEDFMLIKDDSSSESSDEEGQANEVAPLTPTKDDTDATSTADASSKEEKDFGTSVADSPASVFHPIKRVSIMYRPPIDIQPSPPPAKKRKVPRHSPRMRYYIDLPHERDFYATLISACSKSNHHMYDVRDSLVTAIPAHSIRETICSGVLKWTIPEWLPLGTYYLQIGSRRKRTYCSTMEFSLIESVGRYDETNVGVWCVCGNTDARQDYTGCWVSCTNCAAWQHWSCYTRISESRHSRPDSAMTQSAVLERVVVQDDDEPDNEAGSGKDGASSAPTRRRRLSKKERQEITEALAARVSHVHLLVPDVLPNPDEDFLCWACQPLPHIAELPEDADEPSRAERQSHIQALGERCELMINMIGAASGGYSRKLLPGAEDPSATLLCNTPLHVVRFLKTLIDVDAETMCVDLGAGTGSFSGALPPGSLCVEINEKRYNKGKSLRSEMQWLNMDALNPEFFRDRFGKFNLVISNPDFEVGLQFIYLGLCLIRNRCLSDRGESLEPDDSKSGRLIFLLPSDFFEASNLRARIFKLLDFHIETEYKLGHLCYYENQPQSQKLTCDSLFVLRPGRGGLRKYEHRVVNARLAGML